MHPLMRPGTTRPMPSSAPRLPDFIIGGAMKSGTTSIHHLLGSHPKVFIPRDELFFFDSDDVVQHPHLLRRGFVLPDYGQELQWRLERYRAWFDGAAADQLVGEDTTTYLASDRAAARIADLLPGAKLVFLLRDPVDRAYSHYWHIVRHGQAFFDFDATLEHMPGTIVQRGLYKRQLDRIFQYFPREQVHVMIFEEFTASPQQALDDLCAFLGLDPVVQVPRAGADRYNAATGVRHPTLYRTLNLAVRGSLGRSAAAQTPTAPPTAPPTASPVRRLSRSWLRSMFFDAETSYPSLAADARERLSTFYSRENAGLAELLGRDLEKLWALETR